MSLAVLEARIPSVEYIGERHQFSAIQRDGKEAVLWERRVPEQVQSWLDHLTVDDWPEARIVLKAGNVKTCLLQLFGEAELKTSPHLNWLIEDVTSLAGQLSQMLNSPTLRMRVEVCLLYTSPSPRDRG